MMETMGGLIELKNLGFYYQTASERIEILDDVNYVFDKGKIYAVMGPSGSGKTTLLSLIGALDEPKSGDVLFEGKNIKEIGYSRFRSENVGIVFQSHNLLNYLNVVQNVEAVMEIAHYRGKDKRQKAEEYLVKAGISPDKFKRNIKKLSGGEQQRVAIARAIAMDTEIVLADEPTGNLDAATADGIIQLFQKLAHEEGKCVIIVTHSDKVAEASDVTLRLTGRQLLEG